MGAAAPAAVALDVTALLNNRLPLLIRSSNSKL